MLNPAVASRSPDGVSEARRRARCMTRMARPHPRAAVRAAPGVASDTLVAPRDIAGGPIRPVERRTDCAEAPARGVSIAAASSAVHGRRTPSPKRVPRSTAAHISHSTRLLGLRSPTPIRRTKYGWPVMRCSAPAAARSSPLSGLPEVSEAPQARGCQNQASPTPSDHHERLLASATAPVPSAPR